MTCMILVGLLLLITGIVVTIRKDSYIPNMLVTPQFQPLPDRRFANNVPLGKGKNNDRLENYSIDNETMPVQTDGNNATFNNAYSTHPNLLQLPPFKHLVPPNLQTLHPVSGIPEGMYMGSDYMYSQYTPDYLCCKAGVV